MPIPEELRGGWQVEADFIAAIRGERPVTHTDFATGVRYMQFTEAVARSSRHQSPVTLPPEGVLQPQPLRDTSLGSSSFSVPDPVFAPIPSLSTRSGAGREGVAGC